MSREVDWDWLPCDAAVVQPEVGRASNKGNGSGEESLAATNFKMGY